MDENKEAAIAADNTAEEYEATVKLTVKATSPEEAQQLIEDLLGNAEVIVTYDFAEEDEDA